MKRAVAAVVRLQAVIALLYGVISTTYLEQYHRAFATARGTAEVEAAAANYYFSVARVVLYFLFGFLLFWKADATASLLTGRPEPRKEK